MKPRVVSIGDVMMRLSPPGQSRFTQTQTFNVLYAGSEANVTATLAFWKVPSTHITAFPSHDLGKAAVMHLQQYGVGMQHTLFDDDGRIGVYLIESGATVRSPKIIYDRYDSAFANADPSSYDWNEILEGAEWFHWSGITPALSANAARACLDAVTVARKKKIKVSGDINYRRNLWRYGKTPLEVMPELVDKCDIIIAGLTDLENCLGVRDDDFSSACEKAVKKHPSIKRIATTERETLHASHNKISASLFSGGLIESKQYDIHPVTDRVGAGDAFMAGFIYGSLHNFNDRDTLEFATASCALKHTVEGDVNTVTVEEIQNLVKGSNVGKLLR
jgi:2-dehydro-3-deoxygluconokinase